MRTGLGAAAGGLVADVVIARVVLASNERRRLLVAGAVLPLAVWTGQMIGFTAGPGLGWTVELWSGAIVLSAATGALLGAISGPAYLQSGHADRTVVRLRHAPPDRVSREQGAGLRLAPGGIAVNSGRAQVNDHRAAIA